MTTSQNKAFVASVHRSVLLDSEALEFHRYYLAITDSIEKAKIALHKHILLYTSLGRLLPHEKFALPDAFYVSPDDYLDRFLAKTEASCETEREIFDILADIQEDGNLDYENEAHIFDHDSESTMSLLGVTEFSLEAYDSMKPTFAFIEVAA